jgi:5-methyltetrahydrofolate--homocysteine methyltransferase
VPDEASQPGEETLDALYDAVLDGDAEASVALTRSGLEAELDPLVLLFDAMIPALEEVGQQFESKQIFIPEMLISARAMQAAMDLLRPRLSDSAGTRAGIFLMGTIAGDIHDVGKNLCNVMLEGARFEVIDLGVNVPAAEFVAAIDQHQPDVVGLSAFLTTTMPALATTIDAIDEAGLRPEAGIIVGGAPVTGGYAQSIGADAYAPNAVSAVREVKALLGS